MKLPALPTLSKNAIKTMKNLFTTSSRIVHVNAKQISPHIKTVGIVIVDEVQKKADLSPDLMYLVYKLGMSVPKAADMLGISRPYAYKLLKILPKK